jgi:DNA-binding beta-propeller fold protein YncE
MTRFPKWFRSLAALVPAALAWSILTSAAPARAGHDSGGSITPEILPFATGLTNPRHIRFGPDGLLYVAEAGTGGDMLPPDTEECPAVDSLFTTPPLHGYMAGFSGRISRILPDGTRETVADSLPSARDGFEDALGPTDIAWIESTLYALIEGGGCSRGLPDHPAGVIRIDPDGSYGYVADISAFIRANPAKVEPLCGPQGDCEPDGVPHTMIAVGHTLYVVETNHNSILRIDPESGEITRIRDLSVQDPAPISMVRQGKDFYLGSFDGLVQKFQSRFGPVKTIEAGFGGIVDLTFIKGWLYVLETSSPETPFAPHDGSVFRIEQDGRRTVIASKLHFPVGLAPHPAGDALYVSTVGYGQGLVDGQPPEGQGQIVRIELENDEEKGTLAQSTARTAK